MKRNRSRNKLLPRERIDRLLDPSSSFLELSQVLFAISSLLNWVIVSIVFSSFGCLLLPY